MNRALYMVYVTAALLGMLAVFRWRGSLDRRLLRSVAVTMSVFLGFDALGVARGWFFTAPSLNLLILPGGVSLEEVVNLAFLTLLSIELSVVFRGARHA